MKIEGVEVSYKETVCQEAERIVGGDRGPQYGHPTKNFVETAALWTAYKGVDFSPEDVAVFMILLKLARERNRSKRDNIVDVIGYAKTLAMVRGYEDYSTSGVDSRTVEVLPETPSQPLGEFPPRYPSYPGKVTT